MIINSKDDFFKLKVAVFGMGASGISSLRLLNDLKADLYAINKGVVESWSDLSEVLKYLPKDRCFAQESDNIQEIFANVSLIIISPGIPTDHKVLKKANDLKIPIWSELELGSYFVDCPIIAITGTNGKTTTTTIVGEILKEAKKNVFVGGNIGIPLCDQYFEKSRPDIVVVEVSSFQLETIWTLRPDVALILNIYPNHGERYTSVEDYANAKFRISMNMKDKDQLIVPRGFSVIDKYYQEVNDVNHNFSIKRIDIHDISKLKSKLEERFDLSKIKIVGTHNLINFQFAISAVDRFIDDDSAIQRVIDNFTGVDYRVQFVENKQLPCLLFNDAKSTNWAATLTGAASLQTLQRDIWVIIGGQFRGNNDSITSHIDEFQKTVKRILLIGETSSFLASELDGKIDHVKCENLNGVYEYIKKENFHGALLFSPGYPSFDQFKNYKERGKTFTKIFGDP